MKMELVSSKIENSIVITKSWKICDHKSTKLSKIQKKKLAVFFY